MLEKILFYYKKIKKNLKNKEKKWQLSIAFLFLTVCVLGLIAYNTASNYYSRQIFKTKTEKALNKNTNIGEEKEILIERIIDGVYVQEGENTFYPIAAMIENHVDSRPPAGLNKALLVYEAEVEAGITRFLAIFNNKENLERIGPIRSARPYFVDWAQEINALYVHCGGSPEALVKIIQEKIFDFNEFYKGEYFERDKNREAPHNVYISTEKINKYLDKENPDLFEFEEWTHKDETPLNQRPDSSEIKINFKNKDYAVNWKYDKDNNDYTRFVDSEMQKCEDENEIRAKNIVIQYVDSEIIDEIGRRKITAIGSGKTFFCADGQCMEGSWQKANKKERTFFYTKDGDQFQFNRGAIWIEIVPKWYSVDF